MMICLLCLLHWHLFGCITHFIKNLIKIITYIISLIEQGIINIIERLIKNNLFNALNGKHFAFINYFNLFFFL